jgi:LEA14-like dessication related protein
MASSPLNRLGVGLIAASFVVPVACAKPQPVEVTPRAARVTAIGPTGLHLELNLDVANPNGFDVSARSVSGTLEVGEGVQIGTGSAQPSVTIPAKGSGAVSADLVLGWTNLNAVVPFALSGQPMPYRFRGTASVGGESLNMELPFTITGEITRQQLLQIGAVGLPPAR